MVDGEGVTVKDAGSGEWGLIKESFQRHLKMEGG